VVAGPADLSGAQEILLPLEPHELFFLPIHRDLVDHAPVRARGTPPSDGEPLPPLEILLPRVDPVVLRLEGGEALDGELLLLEEALGDLVTPDGDGWGSHLPFPIHLRRAEFGASGRAELRGLPDGEYRLRLPSGHGRVVPERLRIGTDRGHAIELRFEGR
jgi:hypothetical protein